MNLASLLPEALAARVLLFLLLGALIGGVHFTALRWNTRLFVRQGPPWRAIGLQVLRMAFTATALLGCARAGTWPLMAALAGFWLARQAVLRQEVTP